MKWKYTRRKIGGNKTRVRVKVHRKVNGNELVRRIGHRNLAD